MAIKIAWVVGDNRPIIQATFTGTDITGHTVTMHIAQAPPVIKTGVITSVGPPGKVDFTLAAADLPNAGVIKAEIQDDDGSGGIQTFQGIEFVVSDAIA